jgi:cell division protein FtsB
MPLFRKKADPISARSKELNAQITALEAQIKTLNQKIEHGKSYPRVRSTAVPNGPTVNLGHAAAPKDPVFEQIDYKKAKEQPEVEGTAEHYNDLGVRKYDLVRAFRRFSNHLRGPSTNNPKLVSYLAAGSIKGLRPLRYEKRIARNRFIFLSLFFVLVLWGLLAAIFGQH